jgi:hypothetical protein
MLSVSIFWSCLDSVLLHLWAAGQRRGPSSLRDRAARLRFGRVQSARPFPGTAQHSSAEFFPARLAVGAMETDRAWVDQAWADRAWDWPPRRSRDEQDSWFVLSPNWTHVEDVRLHRRSIQPVSPDPLKLSSWPANDAPRLGAWACPIARPTPDLQRQLPPALRQRSSATRRVPEPVLVRPAGLPECDLRVLLWVRRPRTLPVQHPARCRVRPVVSLSSVPLLPAHPSRQLLPQNLPRSEDSRPHCRFVDPECRGDLFGRHLFNGG